VRWNAHEKGQNRRGNVAQGPRLFIFLIFRKRVLLGITGHNEWNRVGGMRSVGVSGLFVDHLLGVAVVSGDEQDVPSLFAGFVDRADGLVGGRDSLNRRIQDASMANLVSTFVSAVFQTGWGLPHHIGGSKVAHNKLVLLGFDDLGDLVSDFLCAHLRLQVIGGDLRRGDQMSFFLLELLFHTAVEEEGNVSILLSFSDMCLLKTLLGEPFCEDIRHSLRRISDREGEVGAVPRHGGDML